MAEKIEEQERQSLAAVEVTEALGPGTLEEEFKVLESGGGTGDVEDRLLALKHEMGLIAAPESEAPKQLESGDEDDAPAEAVATDDAGSAVPEGGAGVAEPESAEAEPQIQEAQLIEEFDKLEQES